MFFYSSYENDSCIQETSPHFLLQVTTEEFCTDPLVEPTLLKRSSFKEDNLQYIEKNMPKVRFKCATGEIKLPLIRIPMTIGNENIWRVSRLP